MWWETYRHLQFLAKKFKLFCCAIKQAWFSFSLLKPFSDPPKANQFQSLSRIWITRKVSCSNPNQYWISDIFFSSSRSTRHLRTLHKFSGSDKISCRHRNEKCSLACKWNQAQLLGFNLVQWKNHICMPCTHLTYREEDVRMFVSLNIYSKSYKFEIICCNNWNTLTRVRCLRCVKSPIKTAPRQNCETS